jgi:multimeric flavodoxin WrbA
MKVVAINGSARLDGNTAILLRKVLAQLEQEDIRTELVQLSGKTLRGCTACGGCVKAMNRRCTVVGDFANECIERLIEADGILLGAPTYFTDVPAEMKALIDRAGYVGRANGSLFARKVGAGVVAVRRGGAIHAFDTLNHFFLIAEMIVVGSSYWNIGIGHARGDVESDREGLQTMVTLGKNMAWLLKRLHAPV